METYKKSLPIMFVSIQQQQTSIPKKECSALSSEQPNANFENPRVQESEHTSTCLEIWLNQRLL